MGFHEQLIEELQTLKQANICPGSIGYMAESLESALSVVGITVDFIEGLSCPEECPPSDFQERRRALIEAAMEKLTALSARHSYAEHIARLEKALGRNGKVGKGFSRTKLSKGLSELRRLHAVWQGTLRFASAEIEDYQPVGLRIYTQPFLDS